MYKCLNCGNDNKFKEVNVIETYVSIADNVSSDKFLYRHDVVCCECQHTMEDGHIEEYIE